MMRRAADQAYCDHLSEFILSPATGSIFMLVGMRGLYGIRVRSSPSDASSDLPRIAITARSMKFSSSPSRKRLLMARVAQ
jgi:hypothetical protein